VKTTSPTEKSAPKIAVDIRVIFSPSMFAWLSEAPPYLPGQEPFLHQLSRNIRQNDKKNSLPVTLLVVLLLPG